uniref:Lipocalin/cytosolic fatty-acid binding domain-containing protein n=1 Tax=Xiphophorus maculatus TaxID=8083 RepID=M4AFP9_XIPMA
MSTIIYFSGFIGTWDVLTKLSFCMKGSCQVAASLAKPNLIVTQDEEIISVKAESTFKMHKIKFKLNEEFDEKTPDGRKVKVGNSFFLRDGKLIQEQRWDGKITTMEREIKNGKLEKCILGKDVATRIYEKEA